MVNIDILNEEENVAVDKLESILNGNNIVIDVRPVLEFEMCSLPNTVNLPYSMILNKKNSNELEEAIKRASEGNKNGIYKN